MTPRGDRPAGAWSRGAARALRSLPESALVAARDTGAEAAEVFVKEARSMACHFGQEGVCSFERREESGVALRAWYPGGRQGFVHSDGAPALAARDLVDAALRSASRHSGGSVPQLPSGPESGCSPTDEASRSPVRHGAGRSASAQARGAAGPLTHDAPGERAGAWTARELEETIRTAAETLLGGLRGAASAGVRLHGGVIDAGESWTRVVNSAGTDVSFRRRIARVTLSLSAGSGEDRDRAGEAAPIETAWYAGEGERLASLDAGRLIEDAERRAGLSRAGAPREGREVRFLLDPEAAAVWVRELAACLSSRTGQQTGGRCEGLDILDDPAPPAIDGEGRAAVRRALVLGGLPAAGGGGPEPARRDSYRDLPVRGPMRLKVAPGAASREELVRGLGRGLWVTALVPRSSPGSGLFVAQVRGAWIEGGKPVSHVSRSLLLLPAKGVLARVLARGADPRLDEAALPVITPSLLLAGAELVAM